ncbi:MAG: lysophospholipid acyltransferase family protein [Flavobacteriales bacterium]|nr:lysophospholipid acyltransferase family protein [Flavobacteriales bacterium]
MKRIVAPAELAKASHMREGDPRIALLTEVSGLKRLERVYSNIAHLSDIEFTEAVFRELNLEVEIPAEDLDHVPESGGLVFVANHPYGAIDGLAMVKVLGRKRPDLKVMANFLLRQLEPLRDRFIGVNPLEGISSQSSFQGMRQALAHVTEGHALGVFPAGEVSSWRTELRAVADPRWKTPAIKILQRAEVPVVPVWFDGANSLVFQMLGMIHPNLRTLVLPNEMLRMRGRTVRMRIGKAIAPKDLAAFGNAEHLARYLRAKTYALGSGLQVKRELFAPLRFPAKPKDVVEAVDHDALLREIASIGDLRINHQAEFDLYLASSHRIPGILREIGRLRELTFRAVGEGTNKSIDLDEFDLYYEHLFLWDREKQQLVGAYRIGDGRKIMARYGKRGFYTSTLFRMGRPMERVLRRSFELGRSFISPEYQRQRLPLFMLWRGLLLHLIANPDQHFLIGPVSISGTYSRFSRTLIMEFVRLNHYDHELAQHVHPRHRFRIKPDKADSEALVEASKADLKKMDRLIAEIDPHETAMPVLLKKYLLLNARIIGFNRDPKFNDALDGLMVLDLNKLPEKTVEDLRKGMSEV